MPRETIVSPHKSSTEYRALARTHKVTPDGEGSTPLFEDPKVDTRNCKELRLFVHVMNDSYRNAPFSPGASLTISAFHGIGRGSWRFFSAQFEQRLTSETFGFVQIPVIGEVTRIVVFGNYMPNVELEVDVAALLVR